MEIKVLQTSEVYRLADCIRGLAGYHNKVGKFHPGIYPIYNILGKLDEMAEKVDLGLSVVEAVVEEERIVAFSQFTVQDGLGIIDYLYVEEGTRGKGYGRLLMDRMLEGLRKAEAWLVDIRVVDGNPAAGFYEKYGFQVRSRIMSQVLDDGGKQRC